MIGERDCPMVIQIEHGRVSQLFRQLYSFWYAPRISVDRLAHLALEIVSLRVRYEQILESNTSKAQKDLVRKELKRLEELEKLVTRLYTIRNVRSSIPMPVPAPLPPLLLSP